MTIRDDLGPCIRPSGDGLYRVVIIANGKRFFDRAGYDAATAVKIRDRYRPLAMQQKNNSANRVRKLLVGGDVMTRDMIATGLGIEVGTVTAVIRKMLQANEIHELTPAPGKRLSRGGALRMLKYGPPPDERQAKAPTVIDVRGDLVLAELAEHPGSTLHDLSDALGFSVRDMRYVVEHLRKTGRVYVSGYEKSEAVRYPRKRFSAGDKADAVYVRGPRRSGSKRPQNVKRELKKYTGNPFGPAMVGL